MTVTIYFWRFLALGNLLNPDITSAWNITHKKKTGQLTSASPRILFVFLSSISPRFAPCGQNGFCRWCGISYTTLYSSRRSIVPRPVCSLSLGRTGGRECLAGWTWLMEKSGYLLMCELSEFRCSELLRGPWGALSGIGGHLCWVGIPHEVEGELVVSVVACRPQSHSEHFNFLGILDSRHGLLRDKVFRWGSGWWRPCLGLSEGSLYVTECWQAFTTIYNSYYYVLR